MGYAAYPNALDAQRYLESSGIFPNGISSSALNLLDLDNCVTRARQDLESATGRVFLAVSGTRVFDPPAGGGPFLFLGADIVSVTTLSVDGATKTLNTDFYLHPLNSDQVSKPFSTIEFVNPFGAGLQKRRSVSITGPWGYSLTVPEDAFNAMLARAAVLAYPNMALVISGGVTGRKEGDEELRFVGNLQAERTSWESNYTSCVDSYKRVASYG